MVRKELHLHRNDPMVLLYFCSHDIRVILWNAFNLNHDIIINVHVHVIHVYTSTYINGSPQYY